MAVRPASPVCGMIASALASSWQEMCQIGRILAALRPFDRVADRRVQLESAPRRPTPDRTKANRIRIFQSTSVLVGQLDCNSTSSARERLGGLGVALDARAGAQA